MAEILNILLIEGRGGIARALLSAQSGFSLTHADRMAKALALASQARAAGGFSAVLVDLSLPDTQGLEGYRRAAGLFPGMPMVALHRGGEPGLAEAILDEGAQACLDKDGLDGGSLAQALRQAVLRSRAEARRFRALFDLSPIGILLAAGRRVLMANPAALGILGRAENELAHISVLELFPSDQGPALESALDAGEDGVPERRFTADLPRPGGGTVRCRVFVTAAVLNHAPAVALYLASLAEEEGIPGSDGSGAAPSPHPEHVGQARKMEALGRLAGGVAHDFNNLLTAINGYSDYLLAQVGVQGSMAAGLKAIRRAGESAAGITRGLMSFSRSGGAEARPMRVDPSLREMAPMLQGVLGPRIDFRLRLDAGDGAVRLEPGKLEQMVLNLGANARDAMPEGGILTLSTSRIEVDADFRFTHMAGGVGPHVAITVEDTGIGMGAETLEHLFEPFYSTKRGNHGTGLGLATVYAIVNQAGGGIEVESVPGRGSRFRIFLARAESPSVPETPGSAAGDPEPEPVWKAPANRETVLVVDDEPSLREMLAAILKRYGFEVLECASAGEAIDLMRERSGEVDLVVTDMMLRGDDGHELAEALQGIKPGLRMVFISGHSLESLADRGLAVPADAFLEKPFTPAQLAGKVRMLLDSARKPS